jgi:hypothetical protein
VGGALLFECTVHVNIVHLPCSVYVVIRRICDTSAVSCNKTYLYTIQAFALRA